MFASTCNAPRADAARARRRRTTPSATSARKKLIGQQLHPPGHVRPSLGMAEQAAAALHRAAQAALSPAAADSVCRSPIDGVIAEKKNRTSASASATTPWPRVVQTSRQAPLPRPGSTLVRAQGQPVKATAIISRQVFEGRVTSSARDRHRDALAARETVPEPRRQADAGAVRQGGEEPRDNRARGAGREAHESVLRPAPRAPLGDHMPQLAALCCPTPVFATVLIRARRRRVFAYLRSGWTASRIDFPRITISTHSPARAGGDRTEHPTDRGSGQHDQRHDQLQSVSSRGGVAGHRTVVLEKNATSRRRSARTR